MASIVLASHSRISPMIQPKSSSPVPVENRKLLVADLMLGDLVPLTWKLPVVINNGNSFEVTRVAFDLLFLDNYDSLQAEMNRRENHYPHRYIAQPGDFIVVMPMAGDQFELRSDDLIQTRRRFEKRTVKVVYIGANLPDDLAPVYKHVAWTQFRINDFNSHDELVEKAQGSIKVSVFDAIKIGFCTPGVEAFQKRHFPGRSEVSMRDLIPHLGNPNVEKLMRRVLNLPAGNTSFTSWTAGFEKMLGLHYLTDDRADYSGQDITGFSSSGSFSDDRDMGRRAMEEWAREEWAREEWAREADRAAQSASYESFAIPASWR